MDEVGETTGGVDVCGSTSSGGVSKEVTLASRVYVPLQIKRRVNFTSNKSIIIILASDFC